MTVLSIGANPGRWRSGDHFQIGPGDEVRSAKGSVALAVQTDGNVVVYDLRNGQRRPLWASNTNGKRASRLTLQDDGNLVLYDVNGHALWASDTYGHVGDAVALQDDGNLVVYDYRNKPLWATDTYGFQDKRAGGIGPWVGNAVATAGRAVGSAVGTIASGAESIATTIAKVPVVGPLFHAAYELEIGNQLQTLNAIVQGERIDRVVMNHLTREVGSVKEIAPYVQTVISFVPGIGPGVAGAIGAGLALAQGKTIDQALLEGVKGALPGGALAQAAFSVGEAVASGKPIEQVALAALPISDQAKDAINVGLTITRKLAKGERVDKVALDTAIAQLPPAARDAANAAVKIAKGGNVADVVATVALQHGLDALPSGAKKDVEKALQTGAAMGVAQTIQKTVAKAVRAPAVQNGLAQVGAAFAKANPVAAAARQLAGPAGTKGFDIGLGLMQHQIGPLDLNAVRNSLMGEARKGFDLAVSHHVGSVTVKPPAGTPHAQAGVLLTHGLKGATLAQTKTLLPMVAAHPEAAKGIAHAATVIGPPVKHGWFHRFLEAIGVL